MTTTTAEQPTIPARFERATPGFGGRTPSAAVISGTERAFPSAPLFAGFCDVSSEAVAAEYRRLTLVSAQSRHTTS